MCVCVYSSFFGLKLYAHHPRPTPATKLSRVTVHVRASSEMHVASGSSSSYGFLYRWRYTSRSVGTARVLGLGPLAGRFRMRREGADMHVY